jgi:hypothetical protein
MCCHGKGCYRCTRNGILFKLSMMGFMFALAMMLGGILWPLNSIVVPIPLAWALGILVLLPSIDIYYMVRDGFWAEVEEEQRKEKESNKTK